MLEVSYPSFDQGNAQHLTNTFTWRSSSLDGVPRLRTSSEEFILTLEDVSSMKQISLLSYTNAIVVELSEDDHAKMKFLTMWMIVSRSQEIQPMYRGWAILMRGKVADLIAWWRLSSHSGCPGTCCQWARGWTKLIHIHPKILNSQRHKICLSTFILEVSLRMIR